MSGNPYGLSGISHYGTMQRVGGKAAGFINKKFFHPSSLRNQEKLWLAESAHEIETKKQDELDKRRAEERQVEELRKQMYLAGQATKGSDMLCAASSGAGQTQHLTKEQRLAFEEQRRRKSLLKEERLARDDQEEGDAEGELMGQEKAQPQLSEAELLASLAKSNYREDVHVKGHYAVWGSWYATEDDRWGFVCCKTMDRNKRCPLAPDKEDEEEDGKVPKERRHGARGKRRRRGGATDALQAEGAEPSSSSAPPQAVEPPASSAQPCTASNADSSQCAAADAEAAPAIQAGAALSSEAAGQVSELASEAVAEPVAVDSAGSDAG